jgi:hypothetical protein
MRNASPYLRLDRLTLLAFGLFGVCAQSALAAPAFYDANSSDGSIAIFSSKEQMVPGDTDQELDVYVRSFDSGLGEYLTREVSIGPAGGNDAQPAIYDGMSSDGTEIFFSTNEPMVGTDSDHSEDIYVRNLSENRTVLVSQGGAACAGQGCGNGAFDASFLPGGVAPEGGVVFFGSKERLDGTDQDSGFDIYARDIAAETTRLVSVADASCGTCVSEGLDSQFRGADEAGDRAFFTTDEKLATADSDPGEEDIYARNLGTDATSLVSVAGTCPAGLPVGESCEPSYGGASADGSHVFFESRERIAGGDTDSSQDLYDWAGGSPSLASTSPTGGNGAPNVTYAGSTSDGTTVYFETSEPLVSQDADASQDVYQRSAGTTALVSLGEEGRGNLAYPASFEFSARSGASVAIFTTDEQLTPDDVDASQDVYERAGGVTMLLSTGPHAVGEFAASFAFSSDDASQVFLSTAEPIVAADQDSSPDVYLRKGSETALVSGGQVGGNGTFSAGLRGIAADGSRAFFTTQERLAVDDDFAGEPDVYGWSTAGTLLVSVKNSPDLVIGPAPPTLERTTPASPNQSTTPAIVGQAAAGSLVKVYETSDCSGEPVAQGSAAQLATPGLTVTAPVALGSTTSFRATAEAEGVVSACSSAISYKQEDPPPPPEEEGTGGTSGGGGTTTGGGGSTTGTFGGKAGKTPGGGKNGIEYVVPQLKITFGPAFKTRLRRPVFRFADLTGQPGTSYLCRVDKKPWKGCTSPIKLKKQSFGRHVFALKAVNAVGTPTPGSLKRAFKVVHR